MNKQPNILVFMTDQHRADMMGCAGDPQVQTPAMDRLAAGGVRFSSFYCNDPLCVPSRTAFMTGRHDSQTNVYGNSDSLPSNIPTIAHGLARAGYRTVLCGRMHFVGGDQYHGFHERVVGDVSAGYIGVNRSEYRFKGYYSCVQSLQTPGPGPANDLAFDQAVTSGACRVIRDHEETADPRPLFLVVGYYSPHDPYRVYDRYYQRYGQALDDPAIDPEGKSLNPVYRRIRERGGFDRLPPENIRKARAAYRGKTEFVDAQVNMVLDHWHHSFVETDQVTVYTSDHGESLGDHGLWAKCVFYDSAAKVPMIISAPGRVPGGVVDDRPASLVDLTATLLEAGAAEPLPRCAGTSLWSGLTDKKDAGWPAHVLAEQISSDGMPSRMIRKGPWKLNWFPGREVETELFNLQEDPQEMHNCASDPSCSDTVATLMDDIRADGWLPERIQAVRAAREDDYKYICDWAAKVTPQDPIQWGVAAPL